MSEELQEMAAEASVKQEQALDTQAAQQELEQGDEVEAAQADADAPADVYAAAKEALDADAGKEAEQPEQTPELDVEPESKAEEETEQDPYETPKGLSEKAQERFQSLANENKELKARAEEVLNMRLGIEQIQQAAQESFGDEVYLQAAFDYGRSKRSGDTETWGRLLEKELRDYEAYTGKTFKPLASNYDDLSQRVENFELSADDAQELARNRWQQEQQQAVLQQQQQAALHEQQQQQIAMQQQQQLEQAQASATQQIGALAAEWQRTDLNWAANQKALQEYAQGMGNVHPDQWVSMVQTYYQDLKAQVAPKPVTTQLRQGVPSQSVSNGAPKDAYEAAAQALNNM